MTNSPRTPRHPVFTPHGAFTPHPASLYIGGVLGGVFALRITPR